MNRLPGLWCDMAETVGYVDNIWKSLLANSQKEMLSSVTGNC